MENRKWNKFNFIFVVLFMIGVFSPTLAQGVVYTRPVIPYPRTTFVDYSHKAPNSYYKEMNRLPNKNTVDYSHKTSNTYYNEMNKKANKNIEDLSHKASNTYYKNMGNTMANMKNYGIANQKEYYKDIATARPVMHNIGCLGGTVKMNIKNVNMNCKPKISNGTQKNINNKIVKVN